MNLNQVTVPVLDLGRAIAFYETIGLQLIVHTNEHYARFVCPDGGTTCSLHVVDALPTGDGTWLYFEVPDVDQRVRELEEKGIVFEEQPVDQTWLWREARLKDPDGNQLLIYHAGKNRVDPPWRLQAD
jgi:catechol 2,3-dioxygenase-like lactoylglutathione lyase family enzyme